MVGCKNPVCLYNQVIVAVLVERGIVHRETACRCIFIGLQGNLENIVQWNGVEDCLKIVIAVRAFRYNVES